ncbi:MAG: two-component regulator propeller domain-containing protein [Balneolales bacterium]
MQNGDLPSEEVFNGYQSSDGFVWLVASTGLVRYDGITSKIYDGNNTSYGGSTLYEIHEDSKGRLWLPTFGEGIMRFDDDDFIHYAKGHGLNTDLVKSMAITPHDTLWLGTYGEGIQAFYGDSVVASYTTQDGLVHDQVWKLMLDRDNRLWIATNGGLSIFDNGKFTNYTTENGLPFNVIRGLTEMQNGDVWVGTDKEGFIIFRNQQPYKSYNLDDGLADDDVQDFAQNPKDGSIWISYHGNGIDRFYDGNFENLSPEMGLISGYTTFIYFTKEGLALIGSEKGASILKKRKIDVVNKKHGLSENQIINVNQDSSGVVWVGTDGKGFNYKKTKGWGVLEDPPVYTNGYASGASVDREGNIWFNSKGTGTIKIQDQNNIQSFTIEDGLESNFARGLAFDLENNAWIGTSEGVNQINSNGRIASYTLDDGLPHDIILTAISDSEGSIWMGTFGGGAVRFKNNGLSIYDSDNGLLTDKVFVILEDSNGYIWLSGASGGLSVFDGDNIQNFTSHDGLPASGFNALVEDDFGNLWAGSGSGIFKIEMQDLYDYKEGLITKIPSVKYTLEDGFPSHTLEIGYTSTATKLNTGEVVFATNNGLAVIDPRKLATPAPPIKTYIDQILVNGVKVGTSDIVEVMPGTNKVEITYSAFNFYAPSKTVFRVKLEGIDEEWIDIGSRKTVYYDYLPDGQYTFQVAATNADGKWVYDAASLKFNVLPPFYMTWWFASLAFFAFSGMTGLTFRFRDRFKMKRLNYELSLQQRIQKERERISRDLHDNVGSQITNLITGLEISNLHIKKNQNEQAISLLKNLDFDARKAITELRETIWLLDRNEISVYDFENHIRIFVKRQEYSLKNLSIKIESNFASNAVLNPAQSLHLLRIIQESLNNTRKYAEATGVKINFNVAGRRFNMLIKDNGIGMNLNYAVGTGNGLINISYRAKEMNGYSKIKSKMGKGTEIKISIPIIP